MENDTRVKSAIALTVMTALIIVVLYAVFTPSIVFGGTTSNAVGGNVVVPNTCIPILNGNTAINFGSVPPSTYAPTSNAQNVINFGNTAANIMVNGGNWVSGVQSFLQTNTLWDIRTRVANNGNQLSNTIYGVDSFIYVPADGGTNNIYFGVNVPTGQVSGTYTQTINVMLSC